jgi:hypothetical protein
MAIVGFAIWVKRLGQPLGAAALGSAGSNAVPTELLDTVTYQTAFHFTWADTVDFLAEQFGPPHLYWLALVTTIAVVVGLVGWLANEGRISEWRIGSKSEQRNKLHFIASSPRRVTLSPSQPVTPFFSLFLWLIFGLIILQMVTLLDPFRRNPRYLVMYLPLFYFIAAHAILSVAYHASVRSLPLGRITHHALHTLSPFVALAFLIIFTALSFDDLRIALVTPEPAYEEAFDFVQKNWQPQDALLTMNTPAAGLYLGRADGFTVQDGQDDDQFLLNHQTAPVDRWLGVPWIGTAADFNAALNTHKRVWFVIDTIRQPVYFRGDWQAVVNSQMEQVWANDNALVYRTRSSRVPLPTQPDTLVEATLDNAIELVGYTLQISQASQPTLTVTLFWQPLTPLTADYTVFLHLRNNDGATVAQHDGLSLAGAYPTSRWQPGEMVIDPFTLVLPADLPAGPYTLWTGLYQLETLERLPVANDASGENAIRLGEIKL